MASVFIPPENPVQKQANTSAQGVIKGGGIHNNSLTPGAGQAKTQSNINQTVTGARLDNKIVGTNAGRQSVVNFVNGKNSTFAMPKTTTNRLPSPAPLSAGERLKQEVINDYDTGLLMRKADEAASRAQAGYDPNVDYETQIGLFLGRNPFLDANSAAELQHLLDSREAKMQANPELQQYRDSKATNEAHSALKAFKEREQLYDAYTQMRNDYSEMNEYVDTDVELLKEMALRERNENIRKAEKEALEQRSNLVAAAPVSDLALQEQLAATGLGMGANNSSGYGETSRLAGQLAVNNQVAQNYAQLQQAKTDYNNAYLDAIAEAHRSGLAQKMDIQKLIAQVGPEAARALVENEQYWNDYGLQSDKFEETKRMDDASIESMGIQNTLNKQNMHQAAEKHPYEMALIKDEAERSAIDTSMYKDMADANLYNLYLSNVGKEQANTLGEIDVRVASATADKLIEATLAEYGITIEQLNQLYKTNPLEVESMIADIAYKKAQTANVGRSSSSSGGSDYIESLFAGGDPVEPKVGDNADNGKKLSINQGPVTDSFFNWFLTK